MDPLLVFVVFGRRFHFYCILKRFLKEKLYTLIKRHVPQRLNWVYTTVFHTSYTSLKVYVSGSRFISDFRTASWRKHCTPRSDHYCTAVSSSLYYFKVYGYSAMFSRHCHKGRVNWESPKRKIILASYQQIEPEHTTTICSLTL